MSYNITYFERGRTGNNLFQWATCKVLGYIFGHTYVISMPHVRRVIVNDELFKEIYNSEKGVEFKKKDEEKQNELIKNLKYIFK